METGKRPQTIEQRQKQVITRLKNENYELRKKVAVLEEENRLLKLKLEKAFLLIEELQRMVFGKGKNKQDKNDKDDDHFTGSGQTKKIDRDPASYRREDPKEEEVTNEEYHYKSNCPHCQAELTALKHLEFFTEDILPPAEWFKVLKRLTRHWITTGYCTNCLRRIAPVEIPKQKTTLGENVRQLIVFQFTVQQLSYSQIIDFSEGVLHLKLSQGEIANILESQAVKLEPGYLAIQESIRQAEAVHLDETGWPTLQGKQGNFDWAACGINTEDVLYSIGQSRGKGNVKRILGENFTGIGVTDDYGAYKNAFVAGNHALCWSHPYRKIRDLKNSATLTVVKQEHCQKVAAEFRALYEKVRQINARPFVREEREKEAKELTKLFDKFIRPHPNDPEKLRQIKSRLTEQKEYYFVCLLKPNIPPDNNKAERALRHLVIKRKKSFGSKTQKGADILSIIYSVVMSFWRISKRNFFASYSQALKPLAFSQ
ncbi:MAG: hypothetical protein A2445_00900 [Candidatus Jacksonbacteria bacterium RIFOXYC2_FULL_44_29]|nr:MAG: IS66 family element, transposase [Parcubacteria group bacterium GW2011_GWC2_44_22]OGY75058.1 MAG: hypothetical protein A2240_00620 [Candidatus Jacksonbacteria bacterium RIFOXYA2_FULL_43_12]OGY76638.1 MAG: hypothetical protein A2295_00910 [Candidatus Jacksonbacteria bacterium RIFOXYB2_FULL_44_15]OGY79485.1 MAG: hypothetical protein A2445_00900 [Candidatus Jacksonbacteria bacterium RIFOXYC2_FULL_44_29]OGY79977.1 MAG: hypothetical protein A2550_05565 [Candidatus Jacksonbacteria bacterium R